MFKLDNYASICSHKNCDNNSIVYYFNGNIKVNLCEKHLEEIIKKLKEEDIETNAEKICEYLRKQEEQKKRPKGSCLKISSYDDYYK